MGILLTDISALEYWRREGKTPELHQQLSPAFGSMQSKELLQPYSAELEELSQRGLSYLSSPVHALVPDPSMRRRIDGLVFHVCSKSLAPSCCLAVQHGIFVTSPELAITSIAQRESVAHVAQLCYETCGTYRLDCDSGFSKSLPATSVASLKKFNYHNRALRGSRTLARALRFALDGSASPMETIVAMLLTLPPTLGGYGMPLPELNYKINAGHYHQNTINKQFYVADMCWPGAKLVVEYDSDEYHTGASRIAADATRRNEIEHRGFHVIVVGRHHVMNATEMDGIARMVAKRLGRRVNPRCKNWQMKRYELREEILPRRNSMGS